MNRCLNYSNTKGKIKPAKAPKHISCNNCQFKCASNFNETQMSCHLSMNLMELVVALTTQLDFCHNSQKK
jgi:hypothetical protein